MRHAEVQKGWLFDGQAWGQDWVLLVILVQKPSELCSGLSDAAHEHQLGQKPTSD